MPWTVPEGNDEGAEPGNYVLNMIDTPGHVDFTYEVSRSLEACEAAILLVDAAQGIEAQTLANLYLALGADLHVIPVLNKIDLPSANPEKYAAELAGIIGCDTSEVLRVSAKTGLGVETVLNEIVKQTPPPVGDRRRAAAGADLRLGLRHLPRRGHLRPRGRRQAHPPRPDQDDVDRRGPRDARGRRDQPGAGEGPGDRGRRGRLPDHRREGCPPVPRGRHGHLPAPRRRTGAGRLQAPQPDGVRGPVPDRRRRLPDPARRPRTAPAQRRGPGLRARDLGRPGVRLPLWLPRPAAHGDRARAARARVQPRADQHRTQRGLRGADGGRHRGRGDQPERVPQRQDRRGA